MKFSTTKMPAHWASYLINGDASGLEDGEAANIDAYLERANICSVVACADEAHFSWSFDLYGGDASGGDASGGDLLEYTVESFATGKESGA